MPTHPMLRLAPARLAAGLRARSARMACLLLLATLAGAGCSDQTAPTSPDTDGGAVSGAADAKRTTFISDLQLRSNVVYVDEGIAFLHVDYELTNPGGKTNGLHIEGALRQGSLNQGTGYTMIQCEEVPGTIGHGTCRAGTLLQIPAPGIQYGPAQFTLTLGKLEHNAVTTLGSQTVNVFIIPI